MWHSLRTETPGRGAPDFKKFTEDSQCRVVAAMAATWLPWRALWEVASGPGDNLSLPPQATRCCRLQSVARKRKQDKAYRGN